MTVNWKELACVVVCPFSVIIVLRWYLNPGFKGIYRGLKGVYRLLSGPLLHNNFASWDLNIKSLH